MATTRILQTVSRMTLYTAGVVLLASTATAQPEDGIEAAAGSAMERGMQALQNEEFEAAREAFTEAIAAAPSNVEAFIGRAQALAGLDLQQDALADFNQAWTYTSSNSPQAKLLRAKTQFFRGKMYLDLGPQFVNAALPDLQAAYEADRQQVAYGYQLGKAYALAGAGQQAEPLLTTYLEENPNDADALRYRAGANAAMGKTEEAMADLERAIELDPTEHENYLTLASIHIGDRDFDPAIAALEKAIENFEPEEGQEDIPFIQGYLTLALVNEEKAKKSKDPEIEQAGYAKSIETCDKLLEIWPDDIQELEGQKAAAYFRKAISHRLLGEFGKAVKALTTAIELNPELGQAYFRRAICFAEMGENKLALRDLTDSQTLSFGDARPFMWEGIVYAQMGEYREAIRSYNKAISLSNRYSDAYLNRAHAYFQLGDYDAAIDSFNECIRLDPSSAEFYFKRGLCYHNLKEIPEAIQSYINAIQFDDKYIAAYDQLIPALEAEGRNDLASRYREIRATLGN